MGLLLSVHICLYLDLYTPRCNVPAFLTHIASALLLFHVVRGTAYQISYSCWHESALTFPGSLHSAHCHSEHWYSIQKPSLISREDCSSYAFYSGASDYTESLPGNSSELLGSWSLTADSASPVSGGADKGHIDGHCRIGKFPKALDSFRRCCWWFRR